MKECMVFLHASSVEISGGAVLFLGHSTAGKSTISRLLGRHCRIIADDTVFLAREPQGIWMVADGKRRFVYEPLNASWEAMVTACSIHAEPIRLSGCMRIFKGEPLSARRLESYMTARCLLDAVMEVDIQRKFTQHFDSALPRTAQLDNSFRMRKAWFQDISDMARRYPAWRLGYSKEIPADSILMLVESLIRRAGQASAGNNGLTPFPNDATS